MHIQSFQTQVAEAKQQAIAAQQDAAAAAREAVAAAREQARAQAQMARDQAQMARDQAQAAREFQRMQDQFPVIAVPPVHGPSPRQEKMMFSGFVLVVLAAVVIFYPLMRAFARRLEGRPRPADALDMASSERLQRIEQAIDAMAIEIERISEGQRFTTRLLAERADSPISLKS
ncbi:MAG TPA: hypothetical protein VFI52_05475 [Gemmatimonadaceae bacterium]|nr:hypothetical protein [Gemmatimonadaceae bacterium]